MTMREVEKLVNRRMFFAGSAANWTTIIHSLLAPREDRMNETLNKLIAEKNLRALGDASTLPCGFTNKTVGTETIFELTESGLPIMVSPKLGYAEKPWSVLADNLFCGHPVAKSVEKELEPFRPLIQQLVRVSSATTLGEPVLLVGPSSFKTLLVKTWATVAHPMQQMAVFPLTPDTEVSELVGELRPYSFEDQLKFFAELASTTVMRGQALRRKRYKRRDGLSDEQQNLLKRVENFENGLVQFFGISIEPGKPGVRFPSPPRAAS